jgi:hypothetical protein
MTNVVYALLSIATLLCGCFTESSLTKDESPPGDAKVFFHLTDGSSVRSYADRHPRVEGGYQVAGIVFRKGGFPEKFDRMIPDSEIESIGAEELDVPGTLIGVALAAVIFAIGVTPWPGPSYWF